MNHVQKNTSEELLIFVGTSAAGKSVLSKKLAKAYGLTILDVFTYVEPYVKKYGSLTVKDGLLQKSYGDMIDDIPNLDFDILEIASDWPDIFVPKIVATLDRPPILIYCDAPLELCLERNSSRVLPVPEETMRQQSKYDLNFFKKLAEKNGLKLITVDTTSDQGESWTTLTKSLAKMKQA